MVETTIWADADTILSGLGLSGQDKIYLFMGILFFILLVLALMDGGKHKK